MTSHKNIVLGIVIAVAVAFVSYMYFGIPARVDVPVVNTASLTLADNGKTITLQKGDRFVLKLGELEWAVTIKPNNVINRVKNLMMVRGAQGVYTADNAGTAVITAEGRPICAEGQMCAQYIVNFTATVVVR